MSRSSLSCEAQSTSDAVDEMEFAIALYEEITSESDVSFRKVDDLLSRRESYLVTDCKSLWDALTRVESSGLQLAEKRTAIEVMSIK